MKAVMNKRMEILESLVSFSMSLDKISRDLAEISWDYDGEPLVVASPQIVNVLQHYISGEIDANDIEQWANMLESREDIKFEEYNKDKLENVVFRLANPVLEGKITSDLCKLFVRDLS